MFGKFPGNFIKQENIPVGCVPSAAVAVLGRGVSTGSVSDREVCFPGGVSAWPGGVCQADGGVYPWGCLSRGWGCLPRGVSATGGGVCPGGGVCLGGSLPRGGVYQTPPVDRITDACENITLPQLY